jgi:uncharacterized secreted protein with C-terminal beta-propeller domain
VSSRLYNNTLYMITNKGANLSAGPVYGYLPVVATNGEAKLLAPDSIIIPPQTGSTSYAVVSALDLDTLTCNTKAVLGCADQIMMSQYSLFLTVSLYARNSQAYGATSTGITRFLIDKTNLLYVSSGSVPGTIDNQFSLDEYQGNLRIATTSMTQNGTTANNVYVLDPEMTRVGTLEGLAEGERIYAVRYLKNTAYVVTFRQTDPLFVIDLTDPAKPAVKGQLKIPGFSEYLHPVGENLLVGLGNNTVTTKWGGVITDGLKLSLFDVADPGNPKEVSSLLLGNLNSQSEAFQPQSADVPPAEAAARLSRHAAHERGRDRGRPVVRLERRRFSGYLLVSYTGRVEVTKSIPNETGAQGFMRNDISGAIQRVCTSATHFIPRGRRAYGV